MRYLVSSACLFLIFIFAGSVVMATPIQIGDFTYNAYDAALNYQFSARAQFFQNGTLLIINLSNTAQNAFSNPEVLQALFFTIHNASGVDVTTSLTKVSAIAPNGFWNYPNPNPPSNGDIGTQWAYKAGSNFLPGSNDQGVSSAGYNIFGTNNLFNTTSNGLPGERQPPDGPPYGIVPLTQYTLFPTGEPKVFVKDSASFVLSGLAANVTYSVPKVWFQYGTSICEDEGGPGVPTPPVTEAPEPGSLILLGSGLLGVALWGRSRMGLRK
jgi:hypothetical protein